ncbi:hypothetical protein R69746_08079 [Paraburkholderia aspalathi]|uniref:hypothetical protein n=1 Tax=Paraburkholderia aspalathi TaxID=1324617 RepID=UPI00190C0C50|nr:hypothetical protein [Paraburkholderia aspalathi]MBK3844035.1 hypothetical protein [Paraburkholderia aspalathi]CAE6865706.1 hypothetical protein R69746_08079 [Paraburkholderia aspalathi]
MVDSTRSNGAVRSTGHVHQRVLAEGSDSAPPPAVTRETTVPGKLQNGSSGSAASSILAPLAALKSPFASAQHRRRLAARASSAVETQLIGATIEPSIASRHLSRIDFDGFGRITRFRRPLRNSLAHELKNNQIVSLTHTNSPHPRESARSERDCLTQFLHLVSRLGDLAPAGLAKEAKALWLAGRVNKQELRTLLSRALEGFRGDHAASVLLSELHSNIEREKSIAQNHDNLYGRYFDSELAHQLVKHPPAAVIKAAALSGKALYQCFETVSQSTSRQGYFQGTQPAANEIPGRLAELMNADARPWFCELPDVELFLAEPTPDCLRAMLSRVETGFDVVKISYLAVRLSWAIQDDRHSLPWMNEADENFRYVVGLARSPVEGIVAHRTRRYGINLHYQPGGSDYPAFRLAKSWADDKVLQEQRISAFDGRALDAGHPIVNGASGSANILTFLHRHLALQDAGHPQAPGMLASMMFLVFDGGHSVNEVLGVYESIDRATRERRTVTDGRNREHTIEPIPDWHMLAARWSNLNSYQIDYADVIGLVQTEEDRARVVLALDIALANTLDHFERHSYFAARNLDLLARHRS